MGSWKNFTPLLIRDEQDCNWKEIQLKIIPVSRVYDTLIWYYVQWSLDYPDPGYPKYLLFEPRLVQIEPSKYYPKRGAKFCCNDGNTDGLQ